MHPGLQLSITTRVFLIYRLGTLIVLVTALKKQVSPNSRFS
jgi:hypothetical protein